MTRPKGTPPQWATDGTYSSGPDVGLSTKVEPLAGEIAQGYQRGGRPPARKLNWLLNSVCEWVGFNVDLNAVNWYPWDGKDSSDAQIDLDAPRMDGTVRAIYSETHGFWIVPGHDTNGTVYTGEAGEWLLFSTFSAYRIQIVAEALGRVAFFTSQEVVGPPPYCYSEPVTLSLAIPVIHSSLPVINAAASHAVADAVALASGRVVVAGTGDAKNLVWYSDDGCVTWTGPIQINSVYIDSACTRVIAGPGTEVLVLGTGDHVWHSFDGGETWTELNGYAGTMEGVYLPGFDLWMLTKPSAITTHPSPFGFGGTGTFAMPAGSTNTPGGMAAYGDVAVFNINIAVGTLGHQLFLSRDALAGPMVRLGKNGMAYGSHPAAFASNRAGQFLMATHSYIRTSLRGAA